MTIAQSIHFRRANPDDISAMLTIRFAVNENKLSDPGRVTRQMCEDYLELLGRGWVAEVDGTIAGFSYANKVDSSIWALFIVQEYEARGLAKQLLKLAVNWLFEQGHMEIRLSTGKGTRAERFYAMQGWTRERSDEKDVFYLLRA